MRYRVILTNKAQFDITVEAEDEEEASEKAYELAPCEVCGHCSVGPEGGYFELSDVWEEASVEEESSDD